MTSIHFNGKSISLDSPQIMSIINLNDDSFFVDSRIKSSEKVFSFIEYAIQHHSNIIDLGAVSSRPFADEIPVSEEVNRLIPTLKQVRAKFPDLFISVDTWRTEVARQAIEAGADMINDIRAGEDVGMVDLIAKHSIPYIMMHMKGNPATMQLNPEYDNVCLEVVNFLKLKKEQFLKAGANQLIIDPGFGFGKSLTDNFELLSKLSVFRLLDLPILVGLSRKSMIYKLLETTAESALNGTSALNMTALMKGANLIRVHDPKEAKEVVQLYNQLS